MPNTPTPEQEKVAKELRQKRKSIIDKGGGGMTFKGAKGTGKTLMMGRVNRKKIKDRKQLNLYVACQTAYAEKHAADVGVEAGDKPLTLGRMKMLKERLRQSNAVTFTLTPVSGGNLLNPKQNIHDEFIKTVKQAGVDVIHLEMDEGHKDYKGRSSKPARVKAFCDVLRKEGITPVVTSITATPLWDVKGKDKERLAKRACTVHGNEVGEGQTALGVLEEGMVEVSAEDTAAIFAVTKPLQTPVPEAFEKCEVALPTATPSQEVTEYTKDAKVLLLGLALEGAQGHIDRLCGVRACTSMAVVQKVLDDYMIEGELPKDGVPCKTVIEADDGTLSLSDEVVTVRSNVLIVTDTPEARKHLMEQLKDRAENEEGARAMTFFDLTTKDRATFNANLAGFVEATKTMESGHPVGFIEPQQLEGSNDFGKGCFTIITIGNFPPHVLNQGAGRLGRPVPMEVGDHVPVDGYKAIHMASKWQTTLTCALKSKGKTLPKPVSDLLAKYELKRKDELEELHGDVDDEDDDPTFDRVKKTAKQLAKIDADKHLLKPYDLAKTYMEAVLDEVKKEACLKEAFGSLLDKDDEDGPRGRTGSVLATYLPVATAASDDDGDDGDAVMDQAGAGDEPSDSDEGEDGKGE